MVLELEWYGLYKEKWNNRIVPGAVAPLNTYAITGVGMMSGIVGRLGKVGTDG